MKKKSQKLSYNEQRELESLPGMIEELETEQRLLYDTLSDPKSYQREGNEIAPIKKRLEVLESILEEKYARWEQLESRL